MTGWKSEEDKIEADDDSRRGDVSQREGGGGLPSVRTGLHVARISSPVVRAPSGQVSGAGRIVRGRGQRRRGRDPAGGRSIHRRASKGQRSPAARAAASINPRTRMPSAPGDTWPATGCGPPAPAPAF